MTCYISNNLLNNVSFYSQIITTKIWGGDVASEFTNLLALKCSDDQEQSTANTIAKVFVRKYTHARINGFITGHAQRKAEKAGKRIKGGANLRENLYNVSGTGKGKGGKKSASSEYSHSSLKENNPSKQSRTSTTSRGRGHDRGRGRGKGKGKGRGKSTR